MWTNNILKRLILLSTEKLNYFRIKYSTCCKLNQEYAIKEDDLLKTEMIVQDGFDIYELPIIIKKTNDLTTFLNERKDTDFFLDNLHLNYTDASKLIKLQADSHRQGATNQKTINKIKSIPILFTSELELVQNMEVEDIIKKLETLPPENNFNSPLESLIFKEINSKIALQSLKKVLDLERKHRKLKKSSKCFNNRLAIITQLVQHLINSKDSEIILEALVVLLKDKYNPLHKVYKDILVNEVLVRSMNGDFSIQQLIAIIKIFTNFKQFKYEEVIDYFWTGLIIRQEEITIDHLVPLFKLLIYMKRSRDRVQALLEKKLINNYHKLEVYQITGILNLFKNDMHSPVVFKCASEWANLHLSSISKYHILEFIESLNEVKYINSTIEKSITKVIMESKIKKTDHILITTVATYCSNVRLRSLDICNKIEKYFAAYPNKFPLSSCIEVIGAFGKLNYEPQNKEKFWKSFENRLDQKFLEINENEILYILLSCAYINKYFLKYTNQIFSLEFINKLHLHKDIKTIQFLRDQLYILDTAMTLECAAYKGPVLYCSNQVNNPVSVDVRINEIINRIQIQLIKLAGNENKLSKHVTISKLSSTRLYTLDALIHKQSKSKSVLELNLTQEKNENTAILIILPDYYCWNSTNLIGEQAMKIRHLRKLGFRVMLLDFKILNDLYDQPDKLKNYLNTTFKAAQEAL
jgi:hypothetical protein